MARAEASPMLLPLLRLLLLRRASRLSSAAPLPKGLGTFGIGKSAFRIRQQETEIYQCNLSSTAAFDVMTHFWLTGSPARERNSWSRGFACAASEQLEYRNTGRSWQA
jgi:hypothetical protein